MPQHSLTEIQQCLSSLSISLINFLSNSGVPKKLILTDFTRLFIVFVEGQIFGVPYSDISVMSSPLPYTSYQNGLQIYVNLIPVSYEMLLLCSSISPYPL